MPERPDSREVLTRLRAIAASRGDRVERARAAAEQIRLGRDYHWVGLYDVTESEICIIASTGTTPPQFPRFPRTQGLNGSAVAERRPVIVNDVRSDRRYLTTFGTTRAEAIVPIEVRNAIVGTIGVEGDRVDAFSKEDERFLQQCAAALEPLWSPAATNGVRIACASDIAAMQRIRASVRENRLVSTVISDEDVRTAIDDTGYGWVIEEDDNVVAFAIGNVRTGNVWALFVHPEHERRGHGRRLHDAMVDRLFELGLDRLWLTTEPGTRAQRFYEAAGWRQTGTTEQGELEYELRRT